MNPFNLLSKALAVVVLSFLAAGGNSPIAPTALISLSTASPAAGTAIRFIDASAGVPTSWEWDFGDGTTSRSAAPQHRYAAPGDYVVNLRVTNPAGTSRTTEMISVVAADTLRLMAAHPFDLTLQGTGALSVLRRGQIVSER